MIRHEQHEAPITILIRVGFSYKDWNVLIPSYGLITRHLDSIREVNHLLTYCLMRRIDDEA